MSMEKVNDAGGIVYADAIEQCLLDYFDERTSAGKDDDGRARIFNAIKDAPQNIFIAAMHAAGRAVIKRDALIDNRYRGIDNRYNYNAVSVLADIYINICLEYDKEISLFGFSMFSGINYETLRQWEIGGHGGRGDAVTISGSEIVKKLLSAQENSLAAMLVSGGRRNPVGILGALNRRFAWNMPGVTRETIKHAALPAGDLPRLCAPAADNMPALPAVDSMPDDAPPQ